MSGNRTLRRHVVCVDGLVEVLTGRHGSTQAKNASSITRLRSSIRTGEFDDNLGRHVKQSVQSYEVVLPGSALSSKLIAKPAMPSEQQIYDITRGLLQEIVDPSDEIYFFASGAAAYTVRAIAGVLHHMGLPRPDCIQDFPELYKTTLDLIRARQQDDSQKGEKALCYLRARTHGSPNIVFMGILDAIKSPADKQTHDTSIVQSIRHFRHALAFNESRSSNAVDLPQIPSAKDLNERSFLQAWFLGCHSDLIGGTQHDGLSLYPLQWILIEAILKGLEVLHNVAGDDDLRTENPLALIFPQYMGGPPDLSGTEKIQWQIRFTNDAAVNMFDLQSVHVAKLDAHDTSHTIHFETVSSFYNVPRKVFVKGSLNGYEQNQTNGTIIHPSVFCILDRNQRFWEKGRFKAYKENLANFEANCMRADAQGIAPWQEDSELLASGVKAFRILVCGKTGVGKSTLINKVFGVEMTEESNSYAQGNHDINLGFQSPNHPGLLIHDSRGWQAGTDNELELIAQFLRYRAFQKDPAEALHVIWFCVDCDVSRIEEADKRTFETIAQYSNHVPVFVVGTKKDKLVAYRKIELLEQYMERTNDYQESSRLANLEASKLAEDQFLALKDQLSQIKAYKADGYVCLSKNDDVGVKSLLSQTLDLLVDERVRLFCVAAQVVDVEQKIDSAITEVMRLGKHAIRTAMVPLPLSGIIGTPTVSRIIVEHCMQCFGFPKAVPEEVDAIMSKIVLGNLRQYMTVSLTQFAVIGIASLSIALTTVGAGALIGLVSCFLATPPTARMLLKCASDMILILERSFRYGGKYVSTKQIEDAARQYITINTTTFSGKEKRLQDHVHGEIDKLIPLVKMSVGFRFNKLRTGLERIIYQNRYDRPPEYEESDPFAKKMAALDGSTSMPVEMPLENDRRAELPGTSTVAELENTSVSMAAELPDPAVTQEPQVRTVSESGPSEMSTSSSLSFMWKGVSTPLTEMSPVVSVQDEATQSGKSERSNFFSRSLKSINIKKSKKTW